MVSFGRMTTAKSVYIKSEKMLKQRLQILTMMNINTAVVY